MSEAGGQFILGMLVAFVVGLFVWGKDVQAGEVEPLSIALFALFGGFAGLAVGRFF